jgi:fucose 4-O-acetylase-like acetyltransferase
MSGRNHWVDEAKALGIILVVYGHVARGLEKAGIFEGGRVYALIDSVIYSFHMPLFFFLSGLFFFKSFETRGAKGLLASKLDTIAYPYVIWSLLQGGIELVMAAHTNGGMSGAQLFSVLWEPRAQFWFLYALFFIFVLAALVFAWLPSVTVWPLAAASVLVYIDPGVLPDSVVSIYVARNLVYFMMGVIFSKLALEGRLGAPHHAVFLGALFFAAQYGFHVLQGKTYKNSGLEALALAGISILFIASVSLRQWVGRAAWLSKIGEASMAIYLAHIVCSSGARIVLLKAFKVESPALHLVVGLSAGLALPMILEWWVRTKRLNYIFSAPIASQMSKAVATFKAGR